MTYSLSVKEDGVLIQYPQGEAFLIDQNNKSDEEIRLGD